MATQTSVTPPPMMTTGRGPSPTATPVSALPADAAAIFQPAIAAKTSLRRPGGACSFLASSVAVTQGAVSSPTTAKAKTAVM